MTRARTVLLLSVSLAALDPAGSAAQAGDPGDDPLPQSVRAQADVVAEMVQIAGALEESVQGRSITDALYGFAQSDRLLLPGDDPARLDWSYWPRPRAGLALEHMSADQKRLVHQLLTSTLSVKGYLKVAHIMELERVLAALETSALPRDVGAYSLVVFGEPSIREPWAWRFEGHHVSLNVSVLPGRALSITPSFLGSNPAEIRSGPMTGFRALPLEEDLGFALASSLGPDQRRQAILATEAPGDILTTNLGRDPEEWDDWASLLDRGGLPTAAMNSDQIALLRRLLDEVVTTYRPEISREYLEGIEMEELSFAWMGAVAEGAAHYYRIQGPDFVFEFDDTQGGANHIHTVWRSRSGDFGGDVLREHYGESHR